ncbi:hypothetical protein DPMN_087474 [Dreissena polymorpha]|uniref:Uncharacterized protein n=1 Tax=Dreissena polymorpha TaxID=45954 RepID=A0A9D4KT18_DREPO|nr:hypothetical protein DPMN_087474 [Dreissena polymorpha]
MYSSVSKDNHAEAITRRIFKHDLQRHSSDMSTNFLRLSLTNGVREMLEQLRKSVVKKVQKLAREVLIHMNDEGRSSQEHMTEDDEDVPTMPMDSAAGEFTSITGLTLRGE